MPNKKQIKTKSRFKNSILSDDILKDSSKKTSKTKTNIPANTAQILYELVFDKESSTPSNNKKSTKMVPKVTQKKRSKATPTSEKKKPFKTNSIQKTTSLVTSKIKPNKRDKNITNDSLSHKKSNINKSTKVTATSKAVRINNNVIVKNKKTSNSVSTKKQETKVSTEKKKTVLTKAKLTKLNSENNVKKSKSTITLEPKKPIKKSKPKIIVSKAKVKLVQFEKKSSKKGSTKAVRLVKSEQNKNSKTSNHEAFKSEADVFANNYFSMIEDISSFYISSWFDWFIIKE